MLDGLPLAGGRDGGGMLGYDVSQHAAGEIADKLFLHLLAVNFLEDNFDPAHLVGILLARRRVVAASKGAHELHLGTALHKLEHRRETPRPGLPGSLGTAPLLRLALAQILDQLGLIIEALTHGDISAGRKLGQLSVETVDAHIAFPELLQKIMDARFPSPVPCRAIGRVCLAATPPSAASGAAGTLWSSSLFSF